MPVGSRLRPVLDRPDVAVARVGTVATSGLEHQRAVLDAIERHWRSIAWPEDLLAVSTFATGDGTSVLTYAQWASQSEPDIAAVPEIPLQDEDFRPYRVVHGGAVTTPAPVAHCFPVAFFTMSDGEGGQAWVDAMLAGEEARAGSERAYPGAIAAHLHVSVDGTRVLSFSEWETEEQAVAHIEQVWTDELDTDDGPGVGANYRHRLTLTGPESSTGGSA